VHKVPFASPGAEEKDTWTHKRDGAYPDDPSRKKKKVVRDFEAIEAEQRFAVNVNADAVNREPCKEIAPELPELNIRIEQGIQFVEGKRTDALAEDACLSKRAEKEDKQRQADQQVQRNDAKLPHDVHSSGNGALVNGVGPRSSSAHAR
jgi:hypothetical protein